MSNLWEYEAKNLLALRAFTRTTGEATRTFSNGSLNLIYNREGNKLGSIFVNCIWPRSGFLFAKCSKPHRLSDYVGPKHSFIENCYCGIYGSFDLEGLRGHEGTFFPVYALIEVQGTIFVGNRAVIRAEAAQVVMIVNSFHNEFASKYFNVPIIGLDEAHEKIDIQMKKWSIK